MREREDGLSAVAAPVLDTTGTLIAILGLQGPADGSTGRRCAPPSGRYASTRTFRMGTAADAAEREWNILIQRVTVTDDRRAVAEKMVEDDADYLTVDEVLETPAFLIGTEDEIAEQLLERRERYGFSYITVHGPFMETFAPVIERVGGR